jgi:hypothetical protein
MDSDWLIFLKQKLYPFTFKHLFYLILFTIITTYITEYILKIRLLKWIYFGTIFVIIATLYNKGDTKDALYDAFKLATI